MNNKTFHGEIKKLRQDGFTYSEINEQLGLKIPKSSLSYICRDIKLNSIQKLRIKKIADDALAVSRQRALVVNREVFNKKIGQYHKANAHLSELMRHRDISLIALAMLYLGEGAKWKGHRGLLLGSSDPKIIELYIRLIHDCYRISTDLLRCRIQHRADQDPQELVQFWSKITGVGENNFYPCYIDKRTIGKPTKKSSYRGVCVVSCAGTHIQLELEQIADIICKSV